MEWEQRATIAPAQTVPVQVTTVCTVRYLVVTLFITRLHITPLGRPDETVGAIQCSLCPFTFVFIGLSVLRVTILLLHPTDVCQHALGEPNRREPGGGEHGPPPEPRPLAV